MEFEENLNLIVESLRNQIGNDEKLKDLFGHIFSNQSINFEIADIGLTNSLLDLGSFLACFNKDLEAQRVFELIYNEDKTNLLAHQNLQNLRSKVARWHFRMLNDERRNREFEKAIQYWIKNGKHNVIDIGSGTGILSLYAAQVENVKSIYAIEADTIMHSIATQVISENQKKISLIHQYSTDLKIPKDIPLKCDLIVSEILDSGAFGEDILQTLMHAKQYLLKADGKIIPWKVKIFVAGYHSKQLCANHILINDSFYEYIFTDKMRLIASNEPYDAEYVDKIADFKIVTDTCETLEVNFNALESMRAHFNGDIVKNFQLQSEIESDYLDGFVVWFELFLNEKDESCKITTKPKSGSCWNQAIFKLKERVLIKQFEVIKLSISCKDGVLKIDHTLHEKSDKIDTEIDQFSLKFLNDEEYLENLENAVNEFKGEITNCLDLSPFPYVGLIMLKESRAKKLWCSQKCEEIVKKLALKNCIKSDSIKFIDESNLMEIADFRFDLIILNPFQELGDLDNELIGNYSIFQQFLTESSLLIPHKITLYGELINSEWLASCCKITNEKMSALKIEKFINKYSSEVHYELDPSLKLQKLSSEFKISDIFWDDKFHEVEEIKPFMRNISLPIQFILLSFKIKMTQSSTELSMCRNKKLCCFKKFAQIVDHEKISDCSSPKVKFMQNFGLFKVFCD